MEKATLHSIKRDNTRAVLESISRKQHITKLEISEETGLSLMTVGKITNALGAAGIILHGKNVQKKAGRKAEVFRIRRDFLIPCFEIASRTFKFYITDLEGNILDKIEYHCPEADVPNISSEFVRFLTQTLELLRERYRNRRALGIGVAVSGIYDRENDRIISSMVPELSSVKVMQNISKIFRQKNVVIENANRLCAAGIIEALPDYESKSIACLTISDSIECTTCDHGVYVRGGSLAGRLGDLPCGSGGTYANFIRDAKSTEVILDVAVDLIKTTVAAYDPDTIYLCSDKFTFTPEKMERLRNAVYNYMQWPHGKPEIISVHATELEAMRAITSRAIGNWLDEILKKTHSDAENEA